MFRNFKQAVIRKPDLDTCLAAVIMGVHSCTPVLTVQSAASDDLLADPRVLCLECGGSGLINLGNLDHHDPEAYYPPACRQALERCDYPDYELHRLVEYVCMVDEAIPFPRPIEFPALSSVFSGMLLCEQDSHLAFFAGMDMLRLVLRKKIDPFSTMPSLKRWESYIQAKSTNRQNLEMDFNKATFFISNTGLNICYQQSENFGGSARLYKNGCHVVVLHNPGFGIPPVNKYTIAGNKVMVSNLLPFFNELEKGWGGRDFIIGSPLSGSRLEPDQVMKIVSTRLT